MKRPGYFFGENPVDSDVTVPTRSNGLFCPALSTICIHIAGTATVNIISNPFDDAAKDKIIHSTSVSDQLVLASAAIIVLNVTAVTGTVTARVVYNQEIE